MAKEVKIYFDSPKDFTPKNIRPLNGIAGLYFIFSQSIDINYPFDESKLLYIGMSEKKTNSIGSRLIGHYDGKSKNLGLTNYRKQEPLLFTYINFEMLRSVWEFRIEDLESYFLLDFIDKYGVYPICNNKTSSEILKNELITNFQINWEYFK
ncbi:MAG: hypothetical protein QM478_06925 [Flavobacteriaceae bacterium]